MPRTNIKKIRKNKNKSRRNTRFLYKRRLNLNNLGVLYNYKQTPQRYGTGRLAINIENTVYLSGNTTFSHTPVHNTDEMLVAVTQFMYVKLICYAVVQDKVNYTNNSNEFMVYAYWGRNQEQVDDIFYNDNTKLLPSQGWANFQFRPPRSILNEEFAISSEGVQKRWFDPSQFNPVDQLYSQNEGWKFGLHFWFRNNTTETRRVRVIARLIFRGKRVSDLTATKALADSIDREKVATKYSKYFINHTLASPECIGEIIDCSKTTNEELQKRFQEINMSYEQQEQERKQYKLERTKEKNEIKQLIEQGKDPEEAKNLVRHWDRLTVESDSDDCNADNIDHDIETNSEK